MLSNLEGSAAVVSVYNKQNNKLFMVHVYHSETAEIQTSTNKGCLFLSKENLSSFRKGTPKNTNITVSPPGEYLFSHAGLQTSTLTFHPEGKQ